MTIEELTKNGYTELSKEKAIELHGSKIDLFATKSMDWYTGKITGTFKVYVDGEQNVMLMKPRATRKGHWLTTLNSPVLYKVIKTK
ncbi:hypothetical protein BH10ACI1_BH10ACI1_02620 [soil metagenome]